MYYIIEKIESINGVISRSYIGYVPDTTDRTNFNAKQYNILNWISANKSGLEDGTISTSVYIEAQPNSTIYIAPSTTSTIEDFNLNLISDIDNPEGV